MMLINTTSHDMSPLVRKELVIALQWMVLFFETSFLSVAMSEDSQPLVAPPHIDVTLSPMAGNIRRIASQNKLKTLSPGALLSTEIVADGFVNVSSDRIKRVSSSSSISSLGHNWVSNLPSLAFGSIYMKIWQGITALDSDPFPGVRLMSNTVTNHIKDKVKEASAAKEASETKTSSMSLPPSPSSRVSFLAGESPPISGSATDLLRLASRSSHLATRSRKMLPNTISEETEHASKALVTTQFVDWSSKDFALPVMKHLEINDVESGLHYDREWRYQRNSCLRLEAKEEQKRITRGRLECQVFSTRSPNQPSVVQFHPYDTHVAVAGRESFGIYDWANGTKVSFCNNRARITALSYVNAHDLAMLLVGSEDGSVRLWSNLAVPPGSNVKLVTAWQALAEAQPAPKGSAGMVMSWQQQSQNLVVSGEVRVIRLWDAESELKLMDIPTGSDHCVTSLSTADMSNHLIAAGCGDGSVRLFDKRLQPSDARVMTWREHTGWVVDVQLRDEQVISGCVQGDVRTFDHRRNSSVTTCQTSQGMTAMAVHREADAFACGSVNQYISVYNTDGLPLNTIKYHEGFMGPRIGPVSCLAFHPHRVCLAAGSTDSSISVYSIDPKR